MLLLNDIIAKETSKQVISNYRLIAPIKSSDISQYFVDTIKKEEGRKRNKQTSLALKEPDFDFEYFKKQYKKDPCRLYKRILIAIKKRDKLKVKYNTLKDQIKQKDQQVTDLINK